MTDRPIIFSGPMVKALLAGRKTQTRRLATSPLRKAVPGDRLWVREAWGCQWACDNQKPADIDPDLWSVRYDADRHIRPAARDGSLALEEQFKRRRPSIHMPRWASRLTLNVTDVRVEWLNAVSRIDAEAEGIDGRPFHWADYLDPVREFPSPISSYRSLWAKLHGVDSLHANPLVVALTFTVERACTAKA